MNIENTYLVTGMTCEHCVKSVTDEIGLVDGARNVHVELVAGGSSVVTVTSDTPLDPTAVAAAVDEAGYQLAPLPA